MKKGKPRRLTIRKGVVLNYGEISFGGIDLFDLEMSEKTTCIVFSPKETAKVHEWLGRVVAYDKKEEGENRKNKEGK